MLLDEIDKLGNDYRGDPASALLEVLDPEQNNTFTDHYLNVPFDLSNVFFIATANTADTIPMALRDRLEIIELSSYVEDEKIAIANQHLINKQLHTNALQASDVTVATEALQMLVRSYTRESGVRGLERQIGNVLRKVARTLEEHPDTATPVVIDTAWLINALGQPRFFNEDREKIAQPGIATGLVWTTVGGDIIYVETNIMTGGKELRITGQLGDVMRESAETALTCIKSRSQALQITDNFFDGRQSTSMSPVAPSPKTVHRQGLPSHQALASAATGRLVRDDIAMTGEITLRGRVLPVGGIREKLLGAFRTGIRTIVLSRRNLIDAEELPTDIRAQMTIIPVDTLDEVLTTVLLPLSAATPITAPFVAV
jgi:ATP-dependent Lon protease